MDDKSLTYEALDRIHVVQTMIAQILVDEERHPGLSASAASLIESAQSLLSEAYQEQGVFAYG